MFQLAFIFGVLLFIRAKNVSMKFLLIIPGLPMAAVVDVVVGLLP